MAFESLTDQKIADLLEIQKKLKNPQVKSKIDNGCERTNYSVSSIDESIKFEVYKRQNVREGMENDFSCGIRLIVTSSEALTLKRYNGSSHNHYNHLENERLGYNFHIHIVTEKYIKSNRKAEGFASISERYYSLNGAFHCLITDCNISGIQTNPDIVNQTNLFEK